MNKYLTAFFFLLNTISYAETWDSFTALEQGKVYLFDVDSLKVIGSADSDITHEKNVIVPYCDSICSYSEIADNYNCKIRCGVRWNGNSNSPGEDFVWIMAYSLSCQDESMQKFEPMQKLIQNGDATQLSLFKQNNELNLALEYTVCATEYINSDIFHSAIAHAFIYQKTDRYSALCYLYEPSEAKYDEIIFMPPTYYASPFETGAQSASSLFSMACVYQDDGTLNFGAPPQMKDTEWVNQYSATSSPVSNMYSNHKTHLNKCPSSKHFLYRINGTPTMNNSSNIIINNKQPMFQLKGKK